MSDVKTILFGAGMAGRLSIGYASMKNIELDCIIDNNPAKWGTEYHGLKVHPPDYLKTLQPGSFEVIISISKIVQNEVIDQLLSMGLTYGKDFILYREKFFAGESVKCAQPGHIDLDSEYTLVKPITDCILVADKEHNYIYRAVVPEKQENMRVVHERICRSGEELLKSIVPARMVDSAILNNITPLVFRHDFISPISYAWEWPPMMFRDYVLFMIDFISALDVAGLGLDDAYPVNATFYGGRFVYVDYTGICPDKPPLSIMQFFIELNINPLILITKSPKKGYMYLNSPCILKYEDLVGYLDASEQSEYLDMQHNCLDLAQQGRIVEFCDLLKKYVESISNHFKSLTDWSDYQEPLFKAMYDESLWTNKPKNVIKMIRETNAKTMLDLAGNMGWYSIIMSKELDYAISVDADAGISDCAYEMTKKFQTTNVLVAYFDLITFRLYPPHSILRCDRLRCDIVLALALVHHLTLIQGLSFEKMTEVLALYTNKYMIIEFADRDDEWVISLLKQHYPFRTAWYTKERFEAALTKTFKIISTAPSDLDTRTLYLCEKRKVFRLIPK